MRAVLAGAALLALSCGRPTAAHGTATETSAAAPLGSMQAPNAAEPKSAAPVAATGPHLCFTLGSAAALDGRFRIEAPKTRAVVDAWTGDRASLRFRYAGGTDETTALGSGKVRRQLGLKLRAENGCNLVYAMWRFEPKNEVVVSVKTNPGQRMHAECKNDGYRNLRAERAAAPPHVGPDEEHSFEAEIVGETLTVRADRSVVWQGPLPPEAAALKGPAGLRTDNVKVDFAFDSPVEIGGCAPISPRDDDD